MFRARVLARTLLYMFFVTQSTRTLLVTSTVRFFANYVEDYLRATFKLLPTVTGSSAIGVCFIERSLIRIYSASRAHFCGCLALVTYKLSTWTINITETFTSSTFHCCPPCSPSRTRIFSNLDAESAPGSSSVDDKGRAGGGADDDEPSFESMGATNTLFVAKSRHTLLFLQPEHHKSWSFPLSLLQDFFFGLPLSRGTPKREVAATCAASSAKKAVSSMTSSYLLIQNDLRSLAGRFQKPNKLTLPQLVSLHTARTTVAEILMDWRQATNL